MKWKNLAFVFVLFFSVFGFVVFSYLVHELSHWDDFKEITDEDRICFRVSNFSLRGDGAVYQFFPKENTEKEIEKIEKFTEIKAYSIDGFFLALFGISFWVVLGVWYGW